MKKKREKDMKGRGFKCSTRSEGDKITAYLERCAFRIHYEFALGDPNPILIGFGSRLKRHILVV